MAVVCCSEADGCTLAKDHTLTNLGTECDRVSIYPTESIFINDPLFSPISLSFLQSGMLPELSDKMYIVLEHDLMRVNH